MQVSNIKLSEITEREPLWLKPPVPAGFWQDLNNRQQYMKWLGETLQYRTPEDWYKITVKDFDSHRGKALLVHYYQGSPALAVKEYIPGYEWKEWLFTHAPNNFWRNPQNRCRYMKWLAEQLNFKKPEDWYKITKRDFKSRKGAGLLAHYYQDSPIVAVKKSYPNYEWKEWLFVTGVTSNFWENRENRFRYMQWLGETLGYTNPEDWYSIKIQDFESHRGGGLLVHYYQHSPLAAVNEYLPDYKWKEWLFISTSNGFWENPNNRYRYMQWLGEQLDFQRPEDWYRITKKDFRNYKGLGLLDYYKNSPSTAVMEYLSDYEWREWSFGQVPQGFWSNTANRKRYMKWLGEQLGFKKPEDWYRITQKDFNLNKGSGVLSKYYQSSPSVAVMDYLPEYNWQPEKFSFRKKRQKHLYRIVKKIFSMYEVKWDFKHPNMRFKESGRPMELDIYIPSLHLAIEYQGEQHSLPRDVWGGIPALKELQRRDEEKRNACKKYGITLIEILHSWDGREETAIEFLSHQFVIKAKDRIRGTKQIQAALKALNAYCKKKQRKKPKENSVNHQVDFGFIS